MSKHDLRLPKMEHGMCATSLANLPVPIKPPPKPNAVRTILDHMAPCWECSERLQACTPEGKPVGKPGISPNYKGCSMAYIAEIDGHERRLHRGCAEELGFRIVKG